MMGLTTRQQRFAKAYAVTGNGAKSARIAGYSDHAGHDSVQAVRLIRNDRVIAAVEKEQEKVLTGANLTEEDVKNLLVRYATSAESEGAGVRATELCGKIFGMFRDVQETKQVADMNERDSILASVSFADPVTLIGMATGLHCLDFQMVRILEDAGHGAHAAAMAQSLADPVEIEPESDVA
jgi:hypothetical protein